MRKRTGIKPAGERLAARRAAFPGGGAIVELGRDGP